VIPADGAGVVLLDEAAPAALGILLVSPSPAVMSGRPLQYHRTRGLPPNLTGASRSCPRKQAPLKGHDDHIGTTSLRFTRYGAGHRPAADNLEIRVDLRPDGIAGSLELLPRKLYDHLVPVARPCIATLRVGRLGDRNGDHRESCACVRGDLGRVPDRGITAAAGLV
jgi:hypothetical protein